MFGTGGEGRGGEAEVSFITNSKTRALCIFLGNQFNVQSQETGCSEIILANFKSQFFLRAISRKRTKTFVGARSTATVSAAFLSFLSF